MAADQDAVLRVFHEFVGGFQALRASTVASYLHLPCMFVSSRGVAAMSDAAEIESFLATMMQGLKARGYERSELTAVAILPMSDGIILISVRRIRYRCDGSELERLGETYTFRRINDGWKIVTAMVHDPGVGLRLK